MSMILISLRTLCLFLEASIDFNENWHRSMERRPQRFRICCRRCSSHLERSKWRNNLTFLIVIAGRSPLSMTLCGRYMSNMRKYGTRTVAWRVWVVVSLYTTKCFFEYYKSLVYDTTDLSKWIIPLTGGFYSEKKVLCPFCRWLLTGAGYEKFSLTLAIGWTVSQFQGI